MVTNVLGDAGSLRRVPARRPEHFGRNGLIGSPTIFRSREQIRLGMHPAPVLTKSLEQLRTERYVTVTIPLAVPDMDDHAYAVDVLCLEMTQFCPAHTRRVQCHQHGPVEQIAG